MADIGYVVFSDSSTQYYSTFNAGVAAARNVGLEQAQGLFAAGGPKMAALGVQLLQYGQHGLHHQLPIVNRQCVHSVALPVRASMSSL